MAKAWLSLASASLLLLAVHPSVMWYEMAYRLEQGETDVVTERMNAFYYIKKKPNTAPELVFLLNKCTPPASWTNEHDCCDFQIAHQVSIGGAIVCSLVYCFRVYFTATPERELQPVLWIAMLAETLALLLVNYGARCYASTAEESNVQIEFSLLYGITVLLVAMCCQVFQAAYTT